MKKENRMIDADELVEWLIKARQHLKAKNAHQSAIYAIEKIIDRIKAMQTVSPVDAVEVVRCEKCKWHDFGECGCPDIEMSDGSHLYTDFEYFCAYGERRCDNDNM